MYGTLVYIAVTCTRVCSPSLEKACQTLRFPGNSISHCLRTGFVSWSISPFYFLVSSAQQLALWHKTFWSAAALSWGVKSSPVQRSHRTELKNVLACEDICWDCSAAKPIVQTDALCELWGIFLFWFIGLKMLESSILTLLALIFMVQNYFWTIKASLIDDKTSRLEKKKTNNPYMYVNYLSIRH